MSDLKPQWQDGISGEFPPESVSSIIEMIEELLQDDVASVLRQLTSDLILDLRLLRNLTQQVQQHADPETIIYTQAEVNVTVGQHTDKMLEHIAETRQLAELLKFYAMALADKS